MEITGNNTFQEDTNFYEERITRGTYTVHSIKEMIHDTVLEYPNYTFDEENDRYIYGYEGEGYREFYSRKNINRMVELILDLGLDRKIDTNQLGPIAKQYLTTFLGRNKGIFHREVAWGGRRWYKLGRFYIVYYRFDGNVNAQRRNIVRNAMNVIERHSKVRFRNQHEWWAKRLSIRTDNKNSAPLGKREGDLVLKLTSFRQRTVIHELLHALGVIHEHQRDDRHNHLNPSPSGDKVDLDARTIQRDSCGTENIFHQQAVGYNNWYYDLASIMHYSSTGFSSFGGNNLNIRYRRDRPDVHIKQARFQYNVTDNLPIINDGPIARRLINVSVQDFPNPMINGTLADTMIGEVLDNIDGNQLYYGANTTAIVETNMLYTNIDRVLPYPQYFSNNAPSGSLGTKRFFDGRNWTIVSNIVAGHLLFSKVFRVTWATFGDKITTHILSSNVISNQSHIPSSVISSAYLATDDQKVAFLLAIHPAPNTISNFIPQNFLNTMRAEIININPNIVWNVADAMNPTEAELNQYNNSVHGKNYRLIYDYILSRFEGSGNFNLNSRLEYFWTAPVIENGRVVYTHFLSDGDISVLRRISGL